MRCQLEFLDLTVFLAFFGMIDRLSILAKTRVESSVRRNSRVHFLLLSPIRKTKEKGESLQAADFWSGAK